MATLSRLFDPNVYYRTAVIRGLLYLLAVLLLLVIPEVTRAQSTSGVPTNMGTGITETVQDIMSRHEPPATKQLRRQWKRSEETADLKGNPAAPRVSHSPSSIETGKPDPSLQLPQTLGVSVVAVTLGESGFIPPDSMGAVGPTQAIAIENGRIKTFNKTGTADGALNATTDNFFASVRSAGTSDPQVTFDRLSQRWFIEMIDVATPNRVLLAMSSGPTITSMSSFTFFQFQHDLVGPTPNADTGQFADQGRMGVDKNALYIGANIFNPAGTMYLDSTVFVIRKSDLIASTLTVTAFRGVATSSAAGPFAPQGVNNDDPSAAEGYFIGVDTLSFGLLQIRRISNPGGSPSISGNLTITVPATTFPLFPLPEGSTHTIDGGDDRLNEAQLKNGSLWAAHQIQVDSSGVASGTGGRNGTRWYEIRNLTGTPTLNQSGTLFDPAASNPVHYWYGSITASGQGHAALGSTYAAAAPFNGGTIHGFPGVAYAGRLATDPLGTLTGGVSLTLGVGPYNVQSVNGQRWGDYSHTVVDPNDDMTMWTFQERSNSMPFPGSWGVIMTQLKAPPPATPSITSPSSAGAGATLNVSLTGTSSSGSGFFEPGGSFPSHIAAAFSGTGVTVNSITFNTPTSLTLNITIDSGAAPGTRNITVTNPDGQTALGSGIFTINAPSITLSPASLPSGVVGTAYNQTITASGGTPPYTFKILSGALPMGTTLNASTGVISNTPTTSGTANFTIGVQDSLFATGNRAYTIKVADVVTSNVSLSVNSTSFDPTPSPGFVGKYTINTTLTNNGPALSSPIFFKITDLSKVGTDLNPAQPDKLLSADNGAGVTGDTQTLAIASLANGASTPASFLEGIGSRQPFRFFVDAYGVPPGTAITTLADGTLKAQAAATPATLLGRFQFEVSEAGVFALPPGDAILNSPTVNQNVGVITGPGPQSRPAAAVDPSMPGRMAVASNDYAARTVRVSTSLDGGKTWHTTQLSRSLGAQTFFAAQNPSLGFDSHGTLSVVYTLSNLNDEANALVISQSYDAIQFSSPAAISFHPASDRIIDSRPVVSVQPGGGRFVAWDSLSTQTGRYDIKIAQSNDGGAFGPPVTVVSNALASSAALAVSRTKLYIGWDEWGFNSTFPYTTGGRLVVSSAALGAGAGLVFGDSQEIARTSIGFAQKIAAMPEAGAEPDLSLAVDPRKDDVFASFADRGRGMDVFFTLSKNDGKTWQRPIVVNDDPNVADQFDPAMALDTRGNVNIGFYDTRLSSTSTAVNVFIASSRNGNRFGPNQRMTTVASDDSKMNPLRDFTANLGDHIAAAATTDNLVVAWTDTRLGSEDIFLSIVEGND